MKVHSMRSPPELPSRRREGELKLPHPFPRHGSPDKRPRIAIYATWPKDLSRLPTGSYRRIIVQVFTEPYAALQFVQLFLTDPNTSEPLQSRWLDHNSFHIPFTDVIVSTRPYGPRTPSLEDIMEYEPTPLQRQYRLPISVSRQPYLLTRPFQTTLTIDPEQPVLISQSDTDTPSVSAKRTRTQPLKLSGRIHVAQIALTLGITPREARQALRTSRTPKPQGGWWFLPTELDHYTDLIRTHLKRKPQ